MTQETMVDLKDIFLNVSYKKLAPVDLPDAGSNQHEIDGVSQLQSFFDYQELRQQPIIWIYFDDTNEALSECGTVTFYDARKNHPTRSEWRLYYSGDFLKHASPGDLLILVKTKDKEIIALIFDQSSEWVAPALSLFELTHLSGEFGSIPEALLSSTKLEFTKRSILLEMGLDHLIPTPSSDIELVIEIFGYKFPLTKSMSNFARDITEADPLNDVDGTLVMWLSREEELFRALESVIVQSHLDKGFSSVNEFIDYSLSVQNRRKSRMGHAFENHLQALFDVHQLKFSRNPKIEGSKRPDFLFPGKNEYEDLNYDTNLLVMLGVKSTSKDRWRQILTEASRIKNKHLCTLQPGISQAQTDEMSESKVTLVMPKALHSSFKTEQLKMIWSVEEFVVHIAKLQGLK
jgi:hypothetical protein